jgi:hypothetical protein
MVSASMNLADKAFLENQKIMFDHTRVFKGKIKVRDANGKKEIRTLVFLQKFENGKNKSRMYLYGRGRWTGTGIVTHSSKTSFELWIRLPKATDTRSIDVKNLYEEMLGTTIRKADAIKLSSALHHHKRKTLTTSGPIKVKGKIKKNGNFFSYEAIPQGINVKYAKKIVWINNTTKMGEYERFFDSSGNLIREHTAKQVATCNGVPTGWKSLAKNISSGKNSAMVSSEVVYLDPKYLPDNLFEESSLLNPLKKSFLKQMAKKPGAVYCKRP